MTKQTPLLAANCRKPKKSLVRNSRPHNDDRTFSKHIKIFHPTFLILCSIFSPAALAIEAAKNEKWQGGLMLGLANGKDGTMFKLLKTRFRGRHRASNISPVVIQSPLSPEDREKRQTCERLLVEKITQRLRNVRAEDDIQELKDLQKMFCELKKQDIAAEKVALDRAVAQSALTESDVSDSKESAPSLDARVERPKDSRVARPDKADIEKPQYSNEPSLALAKHLPQIGPRPGNTCVQAAEPATQAESCKLLREIPSCPPDSDDS